jgi:hypothetical protein
MKIGFLSTYVCLNFMINLHFFDIISAQAPNLLRIIVKKNIFVCKHLPDFSCRLSSLKSEHWPILLMDIISLNQPLVLKKKDLQAAPNSRWMDG